MATVNLAKEVFLTPPLSIAGCSFWLDGADPNGTGVVPSNGTSVSTWTDKSGKGYIATKQTGTIVTSSTGVYFNGSGYLTAPGLAGSLVNTPFVVFCVDAVTGGGAQITFGDLPENNSGGVYTDYNMNILYRNQNDFAFSFYNDDLDYTGISGSGIMRLWSCYLPSGSNRNIRLNGSLIATHTNLTKVKLFVLPSIGAGLAGNYYSGTISEIIVFPSDIGLTAIQQVEGYLAWKWGLRSSLPGTHPFASVSPYQTSKVPYSIGNAVKATSSSYFYPTAISGCQLWMDAADSTTITRSGANITGWNDKANLYTGTATNSPQYNSNPINGLPTIHFDGASSRYVLITANNFNYSTMTYCLVIRWVSGSGGFMGTDTPGNYGRALAVSSPNTQLLLYSQFYTTSVALTAGQPCILFGYFNGTSDFTVILNGVKTLFSVAQGTGNTNTNGFNIGLFNPTNGGSHSFDMGEGIVYNSILTDTQRQQVEGYLAWKWGLTNQLPSTHPNYTTPYVPFPFPTAVPVATTKTWSPLKISGVQVWLDGADRNSMTLSGLNVTQWNDKSGSNNNGTSVNTPTYASSVNGVACSSGAYFTLPNGAFPFNDTSYTYFHVFTTTTSGSVNSLFGGGVPGSTRSTVGVRLGTNGASNVIQTYWWSNGIGDLLVTNTYTANAVSIAETWYQTGSTRTITLNFGGSATDSPAAPGARLQANTNNYLGLAWPGDGSLTGYHYEFIVYNTSLSQTQRQQVEGYLAWKWGLRSSLPGGHPYINFPPSP